MSPHDDTFGRETPPAAAQSSEGGTHPEQADSGETHFFICSSDEAVIAAHDEALKAELASRGGASERYSCNESDLEERERQAKSADMPFSGVTHAGSSAKSPGRMANVLRSMRAGSTGKIHVEHVKVKDADAAWVRKVYDRLLREGASEEVLPYYMHETKDDGEARYLLDSVRRIM